MRRFETMVSTLNSNQADAAIASIAVTPDMRLEGRFHRSVLPHAGPLRGQARFRHRRSAARKARSQEGGGGRRNRPRGLSQGPVHRSGASSVSERRGGAGRAQERRGRPAVRRRHFARVLAQRHGLGELLQLPRRPVHGQPLFRRGHRASRSGAATTRSARRSTGRCSGPGSRASITDLWLRYFPISPF